MKEVTEQQKAKYGLYLYNELTENSKEVAHEKFEVERIYNGKSCTDYKEFNVDEKIIQERMSQHYFNENGGLVVSFPF